MENNQLAARTAKRFLDDRVRSDWTYPDPAPAWTASDEEVRGALDFRERYYGESDSSHDGGEHDDGAGPYKFDSPDSVSSAVKNTQEARLRRRRARLESEMAENEGLRIWVQRRDLWTGAASVQKYGVTRETLPAADGSSEGQTTPDDTGSVSPAPLPAATFDVVPVAAPLLADNPIRTSITPKSYPDIFQKIVTSARTPAVPINLADMTKALVQGWKDSNEWPPRVVGLDPLAGKKRTITLAAVNGQNHGGFVERHPHLGKGVDHVKKILHLNGHHHGHEHDEGGKEG